MDSPVLGVVKMSPAGTGTSQVSVSSCLLYLFITTIKKAKPKRVNKKGSGEQPALRPGAVRRAATTGQAWEDVTARGGAFQPQRDALHCRAE